jgi:hypothetical protein
MPGPQFCATTGTASESAANAAAAAIEILVLMICSFVIGKAIALPFPHAGLASTRAVDARQLHDHPVMEA